MNQLHNAHVQACASHAAERDSADIAAQRTAYTSDEKQTAKVAYWKKLDEVEKWEALPEPLPSEAIAKEGRLTVLRGELAALATALDTPATPYPQAAPVGEWVEIARTRAAEIVKEQKARDLYPNQEGIGDTIAAEFRKAGIVGTDGKPLTGATIKRHALKGISSATGKRLSTTIRQGK